MHYNLALLFETKKFLLIHRYLLRNTNKKIIKIVHLLFVTGKIYLYILHTYVCMYFFSQKKFSLRTYIYKFI